MSILLRRGSWAAILLITGWVVFQPTPAHAYPPLIGKWSAVSPPGHVIAYQFGPGEYLDNGVWQGPYTYFIDNCPVTTGRYELRIYVGTEGMLGLREGLGGATTVATIDFTTRVMTFREVIFKPQ